MTDTPPDTPLVTIMVPAYNHEAYVAECIHSLWAQDYPNIEIVVCDDASPDGTAAVLRAMAARSPVPMTLLENGTNRGVCATLNRCLAAARGEWIAMIASDDLYCPGFVSANIARARAEGSAMVCLQSGAWRLRADGTLRRDRPRRRLPDGEALVDLALGRAYTMPSSFFTSRAVHDRVGPFDETLSYEDRDYYLRAARVARFRTIRAPLVIKRDVAGSLGRRLETTFEDSFRAFEKNLEGPLLDRAMRIHAARIARTAGRRRALPVLRRVAARERDRRRALPLDLWLAGMRGFLRSLIASAMGPGRIDRVRGYLRVMERLFFGQAPPQADRQPAGVRVDAESHR